MWKGALSLDLVLGFWCEVDWTTRWVGAGVWRGLELGSGGKRWLSLVDQYGEASDNDRFKGYGSVMG